MYRGKTLPMMHDESESGAGAFIRRNLLALITAALVLVWIALLIFCNHGLFVPR